MEDKKNYTHEEIETMFQAYHEYVKMNDQEGEYHNNLMDKMLESIPSKKRVIREYNKKVKKISKKIPKSLIEKLEIKEL